MRVAAGRLFALAVVLGLVSMGRDTAGAACYGQAVITPPTSQTIGMVGFGMCDTSYFNCSTMGALNYPIGTNCNITIDLGPGYTIKYNWQNAGTRSGTLDRINVFAGNPAVGGVVTASYYNGASVVVFGGFGGYINNRAMTINLNSVATGSPTGSFTMLWERQPLVGTSTLLISAEPEYWQTNFGLPQNGVQALQTYYLEAFPDLPLVRKDDLGFVLSDLLGRDLALISEEANGNWLTDIDTSPVPMVVYSMFNAATFKLIDGSSGSYVFESPQQPINIRIVDTEHPLAAGLSGDFYTYTHGYSYYENIPYSSAAEVVGVFNNNSVVHMNQATILMYEKGAVTQSGDVLAGRRVFVICRYSPTMPNRNAYDRLLMRTAMEVAHRSVVFTSAPPVRMVDTATFSISVALQKARDNSLMLDSLSNVTLFVANTSATIVGGRPVVQLAAGVATFTGVQISLPVGVNSQAMFLRAKCTVARSCYWDKTPTLIVDRAGYGAISRDTLTQGLIGLTSIVNEVAFTIVAVDVYGYRRMSGGDNVAADLVSATGVVVPLPLVDLGNGNYTTLFRPGDGGQMSVVVRAGGQQIMTSPFPLSVLVRCQLGTFAKTPVGPCEICLLGEYRSANDSQETCQLCPAGSTTYAGASTALTDCSCSPNFYSPTNQTGVACRACPVGGVCLGKLEAPYAAPGYYPGKDGVFVECTESRGACLGGQNFRCRRGHTGRMCGTCVKGYYMVSRMCQPCRAGNRSLIALAVIASIVAMGLLAVLNANATNAVKYTTLSIAFNSLQIAALYGQFELVWPSLANAFFNVFSFFAFNIDLLAPECSFGARNSFVMKYFLKMLLPFYFVAVYIVLALCFVMPQRVLARIFGPAFKSAFPGFTAEPPGEREEWKSLPTLRYTLSRTVWDPINLTMALQTFLRCWWQLMSLAFLPLINAALSYIDCSKYADGVITLDSDKTIRCTGWWFGLLPIALIFIVLYCFVFPLAVAALLRYKRNKLNPGKFYVRYGFLVARYRDEVYWWELKIMARKFGVVVAMLFITKYPEMQGTCASLVLIASLADHHNTHPYREYIHNCLETFSVSCAVLVLMFGVAFQTPVASDRVATGVLVSIIVVNLAALLAIFILDLVRTRRVERALRGSFTAQSAAANEPVTGSFSGGNTAAGYSVATVRSMEDTSVGGGHTSLGSQATMIHTGPPATTFATVKYTEANSVELKSMPAFDSDMGSNRPTNELATVVHPAPVDYTEAAAPAPVRPPRPDRINVVPRQ